MHRHWFKEGTIIVDQYDMDTHPGYADWGKAICEDGKLRVVRIHNVPDTWFSTRAKCQIKGKTVTGFITIDDEIVKFHTYKEK